MILIFFLLHALSPQNIQTGICQLDYSHSQSGYMITGPFQRMEVGLSLTTFSSLPEFASCYVGNKSSTSNTVFCTIGTTSFSYIYFDKNPLFIFGSFNYYFFDRNANTTALWPAPIELTLITRPQLVASVSGVEHQLGLATSVSLAATSDNKYLIITRTLNVRKLNFTFILLQNAPLNNLTFYPFDVGRVSSPPRSSTLLEFVGLGQINIRKSVLAENVKLANSSGLFQGSSFTNSFWTSSNIVGQAFLIGNNFLTAECQNHSLFNVITNSCVGECAGQSRIQIKGNSSMLFYYCFKSNLSWSSEISTGSNLGQIQIYQPPYCLEAGLAQYSTIVCSQCQEPFVLFEANCVCPYGYYLFQDGCFVCDQICLNEVETSSLVLTRANNSVDIWIVIKMPDDLDLLKWPSNSTQLTVQINRNRLAATANFSNDSRQLSISVENVPHSSQYFVHVGEASPSVNISRLLYVSKNGKSYLWFPSKSLTSSSPPGSEILQSLSPIFTNTQTSIPIWYVITTFLGDKIHAFSLFQTVSMIYLIAFVKMDDSYLDIKQLVKAIFIFEPKPIVRIWTDNIAEATGQQNSINRQPYMIKGLNNGCSLALQIVGMILVLKILKRIFKAQSATKIEAAMLRRQKTSKEGTIRWLKPPTLINLGLKQQIYSYFLVLDHNVIINITSLVLMQSLSNTLYSLNQLAYPCFDAYSFISRVVSFLSLALFFIYPFCLSSEDSLLILKSIGIIYKRRFYSKAGLLFYFMVNYSDCLLYSVAIVTFETGLLQASAITLILALKCILLSPVIKRLEMIKLIFLILLYSSVVVSSSPLIPREKTKIFILIFTLLVLACEIIKILRNLLIIGLNFFRDKKEDQSKRHEQKETKEQSEPNPERLGAEQIVLKRRPVRRSK